MNCVMIILNYNDSRRALQLARKCIAFSSIDKIVIVDNKSTDDSIKYLKYNRINNVDLCLACENRGFAAGNNIGAKFAVEQYRPDFLLFANTDTIFKDKDVLDCQSTISNNEKLALVSMRMKNVRGNEERAAWKYKSFLQYWLCNFWFYRHFTYRNDCYYYDNNEFQFVDIVRGSFMMFRTCALQKVDFFDEGTFLYYEEECISYKLKENDYMIGLLADHFYIHNHIDSVNSNIEFIKKTMDKSLLYFLTTYYKIGCLQKMMMILAMKYSEAEMYLIERLKKKMICKETGNKDKN